MPTLTRSFISFPLGALSLNHRNRHGLAARRNLGCNLLKDVCPSRWWAEAIGRHLHVLCLAGRLPPLVRISAHPAGIVSFLAGHTGGGVEVSMGDTVLSDGFVTLAIPLSAVIGILFAVWLWQRVSQVRGHRIDRSLGAW